MTAAPRLDRRLTLEAPERAPDGAGGHHVGWTALGTLWARVEARHAGPAQSGGAELARARYRVILRASPPGSAARPLPGQRLRDGARLFHIHAVSDADPRGQYLTCHTVEEIAP